MRHRATISYSEQAPCLTYIATHPRTGIGKGLYAAQLITPGTFLCEYAGEQVPWATICEKYDGIDDLRYVWCEGESAAIDAKTRGNEARFINHYENLARMPNVRAQVLGCEHSECTCYRVVIKALRTIRCHEEVLLDYGPLYSGHWTKRKKTKREARTLET